MVSWSHDHRVSGARSKSTIGHITRQLVLIRFDWSDKCVYAIKPKVTVKTGIEEPTINSAP